MAKLYEKLIERAERDTLRGHMPGHKGVPLLGVPAERIDFTELSDTGNLYDPDESIIREAERDAALAAGADACVYSAGGSTLLIQGMLGVAAQRASAKGRNLRVLAARDAHRSFFSAMALLGGDADYIYPQYNMTWNISEGIRAEDVRAALAEGDYDAVYVTTPTYYGVMSDLAGIGEACAAAGVLLLVDAAHGAHLVWGGQRHRALPVADAARCRCGQRSKNLLGDAEQNSSGTATGMDAPLWTAAHSSCRQGENSTEQQSVRGCARVSNGFGGKDTRTLACADTRNIPPPARQDVSPFGIDPRCTYIVCCSAHKTLGSLGGGAFALMSDKSLHGEMLRAMQMFGSSSPSYVILASLDKALADAASDAGRAALAACAARVARLRERVSALPNAAALDGDDPTRFVFSIDGASGFDVAEWLERECGVAAEMADSRNVVFIMTAQDSAADFERLEAAIRDCAAALPSARQEQIVDAVPTRQERATSLRAALLSPAETVLLRDADGRIAAESIAPYPPGVPVIAPGEKISQKTIAFFIEIGYNVNKGVRVLVPRTSEREDPQ